MIQVPKAGWPDIQNVLKVPLEDFRIVSAFIASKSATPDVEDLAEECATETGISASLAEAVITIGIGLSALRRGLEISSDKALDAFAEALSRQGFPDWETGNKAAWEERRDSLGTMLQPDSAVDIMAKARNLLYDFQSIYRNSAVLTDVRFIYDDPGSDIKGGDNATLFL